MSQYWYSFSSHVHGFLGVVIVEAEDENEGLRKATEIAPEAAARACAVQAVPVAPYDQGWLNRLILKPEIGKIGESTLHKRTVQ